MRLSLKDETWALPGRPTIHLVDGREYRRMVRAEAALEVEEQRREAYVQWDAEMERTGNLRGKFWYDVTAIIERTLSAAPPAVAVSEATLRADPLAVLDRVRADPVGLVAVNKKSGDLVFLLAEARYNELVAASGITPRQFHPGDQEVAAFEVNMSRRPDSWRPWEDGGIGDRVIDVPPKYFER